MAKTRSTPPQPAVDTVYLFWALLALPALYFVYHDLTHGKPEPYLRWTGLVSCWLLIVSMMITPLIMALGTRDWLIWLKARRRYIGVASFGYAALHLVFWLKHATPMSFLKSFMRVEVLPGWIAFVLMAAMAWTSTDRAVREMGPRWKRLQRWVYPAAVLTFVHWILTTEHRVEAVAYSAPLILLSIWRILRGRARRSGRAGGTG